MSLELRNIDKHLGPRKVLSGVSLSVRSDEVVVILGPNGSGKSTLLK
ncbi:MAG TPA: ATP-binding cassette domain-containing protein, partial [Pseudomonadota bacterium]|nr:ATP-binding cassette domain-containing protein [Pseudomonadota bacterium]